MSAQHNEDATHEARELYTNNWMPCFIERTTPKTSRYPDGGAYIIWFPRPVNEWESRGGWISGRDIRVKETIAKSITT